MNLTTGNFAPCAQSASADNWLHEIKYAWGAGDDGKRMGRLWPILKAAFSGYLTNDAPSRGAAIAFSTSLAPVLCGSAYKDD
jgi:hypothetical protein